MHSICMGLYVNDPPLDKVRRADRAEIVRLDTAEELLPKVVTGQQRQQEDTFRVLDIICWDLVKSSCIIESLDQSASLRCSHRGAPRL